MAGVDLTAGLNVAFASLTQIDSLPPNITLFDNKSRPVRSIADGFTKDGNGVPTLKRVVSNENAGKLLDGVAYLCVPKSLSGLVERRIG